MVLRRPHIKGLCGERLEKSALDHSSNHCYYTLTTIDGCFFLCLYYLLGLHPFFVVVFFDHPVLSHFKSVMVRVASYVLLSNSD